MRVRVLNCTGKFFRSSVNVARLNKYLQLNEAYKQLQMPTKAMPPANVVETTSVAAAFTRLDARQRHCWTCSSWASPVGTVIEFQEECFSVRTPPRLTD